MPAANRCLIEHQRRVNPSAFDRVINVRRKVGDTGGSSGQSIQRIGEILGKLRWIQFEVANDLVQIRVLQLEKLMEPVNHFNVRVSTQFAESRRAFRSL